MTRVVDSSGYVSFAGTNYRVGNRWSGRPAQVCIVAGSVQLGIDGQIVRVHPIRHDRAKEHGAFATPNGRPRHRQDAPAGRRQGQAAARSAYRPSLDPNPLTRRSNAAARNHPTPKTNVDHVKEVPELMCQAGGGT